MRSIRSRLAVVSPVLFVLAVGLFREGQKWV
jgi:hypothetical protein